MSDHSSAIAKGSRARLELEQTEAAFAKVRQAMIDQVFASPPEAVAKRERLIVGVQIIDAVQKALRNVVDGGRVAAAALAEEDLLRR